MSMEKIKQMLLERGYAGKQVNTVINDLMAMDESLKEGFSLWIETEKETDCTIKGITLSELKKKFGMTYPAALLTMDWIIKEPEKAIESINYGIK
ncbi:MAG: hypothetical protein IJE78_03945 [Bacteroidaceae bacterium]|nr:hypothetical protein [Bacteroidaceae bacterium]